ncbi:MAG: hypothetical protein LCH39_04695 [Proteobacteria bacterium]|nr:hypothetical protein [Pseudomonadota bacterium]
MFKSIFEIQYIDIASRASCGKIQVLVRRKMWQNDTPQYKRKLTKQAPPDRRKAGVSAAGIGGINSLHQSVGHFEGIVRSPCTASFLACKIAPLGCNGAAQNHRHAQRWNPPQWAVMQDVPLQA